MVLPDDPVTPTTTSPPASSRRPRSAPAGRARRPGSSTSTCGSGTGRATSAAAAPAATAAATKSCPSTRSPTMATNSPPGVDRAGVRGGQRAVDDRRRRRRRPCRRLLGHLGQRHPVNDISLTGRPPGGPRRARPGRRTGARRRRPPGRARGPCRRRRRRRPGRPATTATAMAARRSGSTATQAWAPSASASSAPRRTAAMMASGSSERGLSLVSTTTSAPRTAIAPIGGRFCWSRSPPQPRTTMSRPPFATSPRAVTSSRSSASGLCA